ncbi:hypothetical protein GCM10010435_31910 [Winogradskya consettensis]|uniref:DUF624 domain-containing protein n=1 Tax=Winogradskya consettensis TaxID=113560 RepID=A0A919SEM4_9ACTN|nr:DUF624 domain-containing protein [Actinoplanes consettensis]GIM70309.1 hypothetical protein Aco04nite_19580 [Actinoplanes consettensis]
MDPRTWRDTARAAADLAVLGFLVTGAALPVVTAGAAITTGSAAIRHHLETDSWPPARSLWATFRRSLLPGLAATLLLLVVAGLVTADVFAVRAGVVPGGVPLAVLLVLLAVVAVGFAGLLAVAAPQHQPIARARALARRPGRLAAAAGIVILASALALMVHPVVAPVMVGYALFALHVVANRERVERGGAREIHE